MKKKACKQCRVFTEEATCPICKKESFTTTWQGRLYISNPEKSQIAHAIGLEHKGEYAIKVR